MGGTALAAGVAAVVDHQAAILHDGDPGLGEAAGGGVVADAELQPHRARSRREQIRQVRGHVLGAPEHIDDVDGARTWHVGDPAVHGPAEDGLDLGVVDRHRDDLDAGVGEVARDIEGGLRRLLLGLDAEHRDAARAAHELCDPRLVVFDQELADVHPATLTAPRRYSHKNGGARRTREAERSRRGNPDGRKGN